MSVKVALLGAGVIARSSHLPAWRGSTRANVEWVVDRNLEVAQAVAAEWGIPNATDDVDVAYRAVDAVDICLPPPLHVDATVTALRAGLHVLLEKPLALDLPGADRILAERDQAVRTVMVAENWVFSSATTALRELIKTDALGRIHMVRAEHLSSLYLRDRHPEQPHWLTDPGGAGGGYLLNAGIHTVSLIRQLVGEFSAIYVASRPPSKGLEPFDADLTAVIEIGPHIVGTLTFSGRSRHFGPRRLGLEVFGEKATASCDILTGAVTLSGDNGIKSIVRPLSMGFVEEVEHFLDCLQDGVSPRTSVEDQRRTLVTVEAMYESARTHHRLAIEGFGSSRPAEAHPAKEGTS